ncbi:hypothetical protein [Enhygromyxa salina]|uniref:hypothetical protein n=1 Tax=Enhygromyxa salina TaxID=215803 RepID=UPI0011B26AF5|nr:hypothetical protein [Enhygromyxa salina]
MFEGAKQVLGQEPRREPGRAVRGLGAWFDDGVLEGERVEQELAVEAQLRSRSKGIVERAVAILGGSEFTLDVSIGHRE